MRRALKKERVERKSTARKSLNNQAGSEKAKISFVKLITIIAFFGVFIFSFLFYTWVHMQVVHINYEISQAKTLESEYLEVNKRLKTEIATLKTPLRIKKLAKANLGLSAPKKDQVIIIK